MDPVDRFFARDGDGSGSGKSSSSSIVRSGGEEDPEPNISFANDRLTLIRRFGASDAVSPVEYIAISGIIQDSV
jgi:hypothetical protein